MSEMSGPERELTGEQRYALVLLRMERFYNQYVAMLEASKAGTDFESNEKAKQRLVFLAEDLKPLIEQVLADGRLDAYAPEARNRALKFQADVRGVLEGTEGRSSLLKYRTDDDAGAFGDSTWN